MAWFAFLHLNKYPYILLKDCGVNYHIEHGHVDFDEHETTYESKVPANCNNGYNLVGDNFTVCQADGHWSGNTECRAVGKRDCIYIFIYLFNYSNKS